MSVVEIPEEVRKNVDKLPTQINFVIAYSCNLDECNLREALDLLRSSGTVEVIDCALGYEDDAVEPSSKAVVHEWA